MDDVEPAAGKRISKEEGEHRLAPSSTLLGCGVSLFVCFKDGLVVCFVEGDFEVFEYVGSSDESWDFV